jgi:hypothetical protein
MNHKSVHKMENKINSDEIPVIGWVETLECMSYHLMLEFVRSSEEKIIFNTNRNLDEEKLYAFIFYYERAENTITTVLVGKVRSNGIYPDHSAQNAYEFISESEPEIERILYSHNTNKPIAVEIKNQKL